MITIGMWIGFFAGMYLTKSLLGYTLCGIVGIWIGALIGIAKSDTPDDTGIINKKEALRLTVVFALALVVRLVAGRIFNNGILLLLIHLAAIMIFDNWHRITRGALNWKQMLCIGGGVLVSFWLIYALDVPAWLAFFIPIGGAYLGNFIYHKYFHSSVQNEDREYILYLCLYGKLAALDGGIAPEEEAYFRSKFANADQISEEGQNFNNSIMEIFYDTAKDASDWNGFLAAFVKTVYLNQSAALDDYLLDLCYFALLRGHGEISREKLDALHQLAEGFDIPVVFLDRLIAELAARFKGTGSAGAAQNFSAHTIDDYYAVLDCDRNATFDEVKRAYRMKSMLNHPDKVRSFGFGEEAVAEATRKMQQINEAYDAIRKFNNWK